MRGKVTNSSVRSTAPRAVVNRSAEAGRFTAVLPGASRPHWPRMRFASVRHAAWEFDDSSHGVRSPSAYEPGRSLYRFASPAPSALRVSHPLSGLIPPWPRGSVSRHIRPWGLLTAFRAFPSRPAVTPLDARCSLAVSASSGFTRDELGFRVRPCFPVLRSTSLSPALPSRLPAQPRQPASTSARAPVPPKCFRDERAAETADRACSTERPIRRDRFAKGRLEHRPAG
jgi:hypothetical protein